jgi:hypothetical protein
MPAWTMTANIHNEIYDRRKVELFEENGEDKYASLRYLKSYHI